MSRLTKYELRKYYKQLRCALTVGQMSGIERAVFRHFTESDLFRGCHDLMIYVSGGIEIGTGCIISYVLENSTDKRLLCPRCEKGSNIMHFYHINSIDDLESGSFGLMEPKESCERVDAPTDAVCVVPALSYDRHGYRLGFGKGFYDRYLAGFDGITVGLCCESCISEEDLPHDGYDISVDLVLTEQGFFAASKNDKERMI